MRAQIGLADPSGGAIVLLLFAALAILGFALCIAAVVLFVRARRKWGFSLLVVGLVLASPALWFVWTIFEDEIPRSKSWDFSVSRDVAQLQDDKPAGSDYYYQGNIRSTVKLGGGRHWSGNAYLVVIRAQAGKITGMHWQSRGADVAATYELAGRIFKDLALPAKGLAEWHAQAQRGGPAAFGVFEKTAPDESIEILVRGSPDPDNWSVHVNVRWNEKS